mgnify:CR=1 FL=1
MSLKIGEKIEIKKPQEKTTTMSQTFFDIVAVLKSNKVKEIDKLQWCQSLLAILENYYKEDELKSVQNAKKYATPVLHTLTEKSSVENMAIFFDYYKKLYCFCSRRDFESFVDYMEFGMPKKVLANRREYLKPLVDALNRCAFDPKLQYIIASYPPSSAKTYLTTMFSAWAFGLSIDNSIIRLSYSDELALGASNNVKGWISSPEFAEIFPLFKLYNGKPFEIEKTSDWKIKNSHVAKSNHIARSRGGSVTGERASFAFILDDMLKGAEEVNAIKIQDDMWNQWKTDWINRKTDDPITYIFVGTQWSNVDILNRIIVERDSYSPLQPTDNKYVMESEDHSTIVIRVPLLDEEGKTTCPFLYSQEEAERLRDTTDPFMFSCTYQQQPIAPTGREFDDTLLLHYDELPLDEYGNIACNKGTVAALDPARKGKDNISMPICKHGYDDYYYLVDCLFQQKPMTDLYDDICDKIILNAVTLLVIENNTDTSLAKLIEEHLYKKGYYLCEIRVKYNTQPKEQRIKDNRGIVRNRIKFKNKLDYQPNSDYGRFMYNLTMYSFDYPSKHDDAPDSISMMASEIIMGKGIVPKAKPFKRFF